MEHKTNPDSNKAHPSDQKGKTNPKSTTSKDIAHPKGKEETNILNTSQKYNIEVNLPKQRVYFDVKDLRVEPQPIRVVGLDIQRYQPRSESPKTSPKSAADP